jgi:hypothetical protein
MAITFKAWYPLNAPIDVDDLVRFAEAVQAQSEARMKERCAQIVADSNICEHLADEIRAHADTEAQEWPTGQ